jgi:hypothetical protein
MSIYIVVLCAKIDVFSCIQMNLLIFLRLLKLTGELFKYPCRLFSKCWIFPSVASAIQFYANAQQKIR